VIFSSRPIKWGRMWLLVLAWSGSVTSAAVPPFPLAEGGSRVLLAQAWPIPAADTARKPCLAGSAVANKIASSLRRLVQRMQHDGVTAANVTAHHTERYSTPLVHVDTEGRVHTAILLTAFDPQVEPVLTAQRVAIERVAVEMRLVQGWIPFDRLATVAALPFVRYLRPPSYAHRR